MHRNLLMVGRLFALVGALASAGCQLAVDFDRDAIPTDTDSDAGPADGGVNDAAAADAD